MKARVIDLSPARLALLLVATLLLLAGATWFTLVAPKLSRTKSLDAAIAQTRTQLTQLGGHAHSATRTAPRASGPSQALLATRALPNVVAMPQIIYQLSRIATEENVALTGITPGATIPYSGFDAVPLTITLTGDFLNVESFLQQLRAQVRLTKGAVAATGRLYDVLGVTLQTTTPVPKVTATLTLDAFSYSGIALPAPGTTGTTTTTTSAAG